MADSASAVLGTASLPTTDALDSAAAFAREPFLSEGEDAAVALAPGTPRRRALDAALAEIEAGATVPSVAWRREWSLLLGLDRVLSQEEPHLVDGTTLSAHQVDALSGTLTALLAEVERVEGAASASANNELEPAELASAGIPGEVELPDELQEDEGDDEPQDWSDDGHDADDADQMPEQPEDPNAGKRFWFEHATGAGKTVAALGFVESSQSGGVLILTHRRNLVDQFHGELKDRGYAKRITPPLLLGQDAADGPVTVETYQWFVRNAGNISDAYTIVICDEAHTALGEKTSGAIRAWGGPVFVGMTATGALIARHVTDLFPTQTSRFDLAQAARRGVISPLRSVRIPPGPGVRTIAKVPLRRGEVDVEFDQEMLAELLDQQPFNVAIADLYKTRFDSVPGVVYTAGVRHAHNVADAFRDIGLKARAVSGETPKRELAQILAAYEHGEIDVLVNAQLLAEGWNSPRATVCLHLAPTASKRIYQQRVGRVTRRHPGKEAGIVVDFVHPATKHDDPVVTLHSLLDRDVYRGGAIIVGPVRRGRGRRLRVERRVVPVTADPDRRIEVFERELWRIAVEHLDWGEQVQWAALAGARVTLTGWRRARAMLHFDQGGELKRTFLVTAVQRNKNAQLRLRALQEIAAARDDDAFDAAIEVMAGWSSDEQREGVKVVLQALAEKKLGRRDQANNWIWRCAEYTREVHEEYAVQRWPETKRLLGLLTNSAAGAHARNARRLVHAARDQDRRLQAAVLAAALPHTAEAGEIINGARARLARKPPSLARELLKNFPKPKAKKSRRRRRKGAGEAGEEPELFTSIDATSIDATGSGAEIEPGEAPDGDGPPAAESGSSRKSSRRRRGRRRGRGNGQGAGRETPAGDDAAPGAESGTPTASTGDATGTRSESPRGRVRRRSSRRRPDADPAASAEANAVSDPDATSTQSDDVSPTPAGTGEAGDGPAPRPRRSRARAAVSDADADSTAVAPAGDDAQPETPAPKRASRARKLATATSAADSTPDGEATEPAAAAPGKRRTRAVSAEDAAKSGPEATADVPAATDVPGSSNGDSPSSEAKAAPARRRRSTAAAEATEGAEAAAPAPRRTGAKAAAAAETGEAPAPVRRTRKTAASSGAGDPAAPEGAAEAPAKPRRKPAAAKPTAAELRAREQASAEVVAVAPRRPRPTRRKVAPGVDLADSARRVSEAVRGAEGEDRPTEAA